MPLVWIDLEMTGEVQAYNLFMWICQLYFVNKFCESDMIENLEVALFMKPLEIQLSTLLFLLLLPFYSGSLPY